MNLRDITEQHRYPGWLVRSPRWIYIHYLLLRFFFLRSRVCRRKLARLIRHHPSRSLRILDAGCGEGQYIVPLSREFPTRHFTGIDVLRDHIHFLARLKKEQNLTNCEFEQESIEDHLARKGEYGLIYFIGVLQYTRSPQKILQSAFDALTPEGRLMIYTPVTGGFEFGFYRFIRRRTGHYDDARRHHAPIDGDQLRKWVQSAGYRILEEEGHYHKLAALGHQIMQSILMLITHWPGLFKLIPGLFFIILTPIFVPLQWADAWVRTASRVRSNGLLLILQK